MPMMDGKGPMMGKGNTMMGDTPEGESEASSVFLSKADLGGKSYKVGDTITLKVTDVDPETGDVQAELSAGETQGGGLMNDFDRAVPEED